MRVAVFGYSAFGGVQMRGVALAKQKGWDFVDLGRPFPDTRWDVGILVKYHQGITERIRSAVDKLIFDPLDCWEQEAVSPTNFWRAQFQLLRPDIAIATSPACLSTMGNAVDSKLPVQLVHSPHGPDTNAYCPRERFGAVWYCGDSRYLNCQYRDAVAKACQMLNREFVMSPGRADCIVRKEGASVMLHPRCGRTDTLINRVCKPQVKLANAAKCGLPVLATCCPAAMSLSSSIVVLQAERWADTRSVADCLNEAFGAAPVEPELAEDRHAEIMLSLVQG